MAAKTRADLLTEAEANLADNTTEQISAQDVRDMVKNIVDSVFNILADTAALLRYEDGLGGSPTLYPTVHDALQAIFAGTVHALLAGRQTLSGGFSATAYNAGSFGAGSPNVYTPDPADGQLQYVDNNGAFEIQPPATDTILSLLITNVSGAGAVTFSNFAPASSNGDTLTTTVGHKFLIQIIRINGTATYHVKALQ